MLNKLTLSMLALALLLTPACKNKKNGETKEVSKQAASEPTKAAPVKPAAAEEKTEDQVDGKVVAIETSMGTFKIELDREKAPKSVNNFLRYVKDKHYDGTIFHRVIKGFMVQGGGFTPAFKKKPTREPIQNEADNGLKNDRGTVAMARTGRPHSATAQFFVNVVDNAFLNHRSKTQRGWGYTVFGKVTDGMDVVDKIRNVQTGPKGPFSKDAPQTDVAIKSAKILE